MDKIKISDDLIKLSSVYEQVITRETLMLQKQEEEAKLAEINELLTILNTKP